MSLSAFDLMPNHSPRNPAPRLRIFISSHPAEDALAAQLATTLAARGWEVWRHLERSKSAAYRVTTQQAIDHAHVVIVFWSQVSSQSPWVIDEADVGMKKSATVAVELGGVTGPLGFAGAVRVGVRSAAALSDRDQQGIQEAVLDIAADSGLLGRRRTWLDRSLSAALANLLINAGVFAILALVAAAARWPAFLLGTTGLTICTALTLGSIAGGYAFDWLGQKHGARPRAYRRRLLWRWCGEALGSGVGGLIGYLALGHLRGHDLSELLSDGLMVMLAGMTVVSLALLAPKFTSLLSSRRLQRSLLGRPG